MNVNARIARAKAIAACGTIDRAIESGAMSQFQDLSVSEAIVLGLYRQGVTKYFAIFGHGTTDIAEALRVYESEGLVRTYNLRHETAAAHAATALKMLTGETAAVITSIGPGALHAFAGSLCAASNGAGVYHLYGDETTHGEGFNMQQIPKDEQGLFLKLCSVMGNTCSIYEPWSVVSALRSGATTVGAAGFNRPFFMLAPMNVQPAMMKNFNLRELPAPVSPQRLGCADESAFRNASVLAKNSNRAAIKIGQGAKGCGPEVIELAGLLDAAIVTGPNASGIVPYSEPRNMTAGGSKGSLSGNYAMNEADLVIVVGARAVCQWDSSGTAWKQAAGIVNFNTDPYHALHYNMSAPIIGDAKTNLRRWIDFLKAEGFAQKKGESDWARKIFAKRAEWESFKKERYLCPPLYDEVWKKEVLTQPVAIKTACDFADSIGALKIFDAGDVQANGFQIVQDEKAGMTLTDTGSSYMGFAPSAVLVSAVCGVYPVAFCGDGSFMMNPQILIDAVEHRCRGCIVIFDNRRMAAITGLQKAQYGVEYKTNDSVSVDYAQMANAVKGVNGMYGGHSVSEFQEALSAAARYRGLSVVHIPVYSGNHELSGMGAFGDWNVGNWCERVQAEHHRIGL
jgi:thiamine pyrophosphate-dependent acetolactate synthase large subunit-like protein